MTKSENDKQIKRILVALDASPHSLAALDLAAELASKLRAELMGIFVEDENLYRLAALPFSHEVGFLTAKVRKLDTPIISRQLRSRARQALQAMELTAERTKLHWSFRSVQGVIPKELLTAALDADLIILGKSGWSKRKQLGSTARVVVLNAPRQAFFLRPGIHLGLSMMVIFDGTHAAQRALTNALVMHTGADPLNILILAKDEDSFNMFQTEVQIQAGETATPVIIQWLPEIDQSKLAHMARSTNCGILILPPDSETISGDMLVDLLNNTDCGVFLVK